MMGSLLGMAFLLIPKAQALEEPAISIDKVQFLARGDNFAWMEFVVSDPGSNSINFYYSKKGESEKFHQYVSASSGLVEGSNYVVMLGLVPGATYEYYYTIKSSDEDVVTRSKTKTFKTKETDFITIQSVSPETVKVGDTLTLTGKGFGSSEGKVEVGQCYMCNDSVLSWSDKKITVRIGSHANNGPVRIHAYPISSLYSTARRPIYQKTIEGPEVAVSDGQNRIYVLNETNRVCGNGLVFDSYDAIKNLNNIYFEKYGRGAKCDELAFHLQSKTTHTRLKGWLIGQAEGKWWDSIITKYEGKTIYDTNPKGVFLVTREGLRHIPSLQVAVAHGIDIDDATLVKELNDSLYQYQVYYGKYSRPLVYTEGEYYQDIDNVLKGESPDTGDEALDQYVTDHLKLLTLIDPGESTDKDFKGICTFVACGKKY